MLSWKVIENADKSRFGEGYIKVNKSIAKGWKSFCGEENLIFTMSEYDSRTLDDIQGVMSHFCLNITQTLHAFPLWGNRQIFLSQPQTHKQKRYIILSTSGIWALGPLIGPLETMCWPLLFVRHFLWVTLLCFSAIYQAKDLNSILIIIIKVLFCLVSAHEFWNTKNLLYVVEHLAMAFRWYLNHRWFSATWRKWKESLKNLVSIRKTITFCHEERTLGVKMEMPKGFGALKGYLMYGNFLLLFHYT